jgi:hypothetical protein
VKGHQNTWNRSQSSGRAGRSGTSRRYSCATPVIGSGSVTDAPGTWCPRRGSARSCRPLRWARGVLAGPGGGQHLPVTADVRRAATPAAAGGLVAQRPRLIHRPQHRTTHRAGGRLRAPRPRMETRSCTPVGSQLREEHLHIEWAQGRGPRHGCDRSHPAAAAVKHVRQQFLDVSSAVESRDLFDSLAGGHCLPNRCTSAARSRGQSHTSPCGPGSEARRGPRTARQARRARIPRGATSRAGRSGAAPGLPWWAGLVLPNAAHSSLRWPSSSRSAVSPLRC